MTIKQITNLTTFIVAFAVSVAFAGIFKSESEKQAERMTAIITQDVENGESRERNIYDYSHFVNQTESYVSASEAIDYSGVPVEFAEAWQAHMKAWRNHANNLNPTKTNCRKMLVRISDETIVRDNAEITRTWYEVLRIAKERGAYIPLNAYE